MVEMHGHGPGSINSADCHVGGGNAFNFASFFFVVVTEIQGELFV